MRTIDAGRLVLENFKESDLPSFVELIEDYRKSEYSKYDHQWTESLEELKKVLQWFSSNDDFLAARLKGEPGIIGFVSLLPGEAENAAVYNLGYVFKSQYHGCGYAFEACSAYLDFAERNLNPGLFASGTAKVNIKSCELLAKLGFEKVKEEKAHFQKAEDGSPIEFVGIFCTKHVNRGILKAMDTFTGQCIDFFKSDRFATNAGIGIVEARKGYAKVEMTVEDRHLNGANVLHGGALFTMADFAFAIASNSHGRVALSISASISFVKAVKLGAHVIAEAKELSIGHKLGVYSIEIRDAASGDLYASMQGTVYRKEDIIPALANA